MDAAVARPIRYDPRDGRPDSALEASAWSAVLIVGGFAALVLIPLIFATLVGILVLISPALANVLEGLVDEPAPDILEEDDVIEARFVQLGRDFQEQLPNREVPLLDTAPPELSQVPTENTPDEVPEDVERPEERPPNAVTDDLLRDVLNRSEVFAEMAEEREREGSVDGIEEGTERTATEGDIYRGRLYSFFRRGWTVPTTLDRDAIANLTVVMDVRIGQELEIVSFAIRRESGNPLFDESAVQQLTRLQASDQRIPPPPEDEADQYIGTTIAVRYSGRQAR